MPAPDTYARPMADGENARTITDQDRIRILEDGYAAWNRTGRFPIDAFHEDVVWVPVREDPDFRVYEGLDELQSYSETWTGNFDELQIETLEIVGEGNRLLAHIKLTGKGTGSGVPVEMEYGILYTLRGEMIIRAEEYSDLEQGRRVLHAPTEVER
ncbi:hypothetical protein BH20ACT15_BH20ACT15_15390 [soil metagenome]